MESKDTDKDLLWELVNHVRLWLTTKYNKRRTVLTTSKKKWSEIKEGGRLIADNVKIESEYCYVEEPFPAGFWACKITESGQSPQGFAPRRWTTEIGFEPKTREKADFSCIISYSDAPGYFGDCEPAPFPSIPNLIKALFDDSNLICVNGVDELTIEPKELNVGDLKSFWEKLLNNEREIPYIYISPSNDIGDTNLLIDPFKLATAVGGNAKVYYSRDPRVISEMDYCFNAGYRCFDGAVRVYLPQINLKDPGDQYEHRFFSRNDIINKNKDDDQKITQILRRAIAQNAYFYEDKLFRIEDCIEMRKDIRRKKQIEWWNKKHQEEINTVEAKHSFELGKVNQNSIVAIKKEILKRQEIEQKLAEEEQKRINSEDDVKALKAEKKELQAKLHEATQKADSTSYLFQENKNLKKACEYRQNIKDFPKSPEALAEFIQTLFSDKIVFLKGAIKNCDISCSDLWSFLYNLSTVMWDLKFNNRGGDIYDKFQQKTGFDVAKSEGAMTHGNSKISSSFEKNYNGETINIEPHYTFKNRKNYQSIHFGFSEKDQKRVIGHCGEHLEIGSSFKKRK